MAQKTMKYRIKQSESQQEGSPVGLSVRGCVREGVPRMRLRTIILQQSLCLISYSSNTCGELQFPRWACFSPALPRSDCVLWPCSDARPDLQALFSSSQGKHTEHSGVWPLISFSLELVVTAGCPCCFLLASSASLQRFCSFLLTPSSP